MVTCNKNPLLSFYCVDTQLFVYPSTCLWPMVYLEIHYLIPKYFRTLLHILLIFFFFFKWKFLSRGGATATVEATLSSYVVSHMGGPLLISILFPLLSENILPMIFKSF